MSDNILKESLDFLLGPLIPACLFTLLAVYSMLILPLALPLWWGFKISGYIDASTSEERFLAALRTLSKPHEMMYKAMGG